MTKCPFIFNQLKSNYSHFRNHDLFMEAKNFTELIGINLNMMTFYAPDFYMEDETSHWCWPKLQHFAVDLFGLHGSNNQLMMFLKIIEGDLTTLNISDCYLRLPTLKKLPEMRPNLTTLVLTDVTFKVKPLL